MLTERVIKVPKEISDNELKEWIKIKVDRFYNAKLQAPNLAAVEVEKQAYMDANKMVKEESPEVIN